MRCLRWKRAVPATANDIRHALAAVASHRLTARIGDHAGTAVERRSNLFGLDVSIAARLAAQAGPGEILLSETTTSLTTGFLWNAPIPQQLRGVPSPIMTRSLIASRQLDLVAG